MITRRHRYAVDRVETDYFVLTDEQAGTVRVARSSLPPDTGEGAVLSVLVSADGQPDWATARRDRGEEDRRLAKGQERLRRLRTRDPGGDILL